MNQGLLGALDQYWNVQEKPSLKRRNTYFENDPQVVLRVGLFVSVAMTMLFMCFVMVGGIL